MQGSAITFAKQLRAELDLCSGVSRAKDGPSPDSKKASKTSATSGRFSRLLSRLIIPEGFLSRTSQASLFEMESDGSQANFTNWVTAWRQSCSELQTLVRATVGSGSSYSQFWGSPTVSQGEWTYPKGSDHSNTAETLYGQVANWLTPHGTCGIDHTGKIGAGGEFAKQVENWTTPQAFDVTARGSGQKPCSAAGNACLATDAMNWATPKAHDQNADRGSDEYILRSMNRPGANRELAHDVRFWATPNTPNGGRTLTESDVIAKGATDKGKRQVPLDQQARFFSPQDQKTQDGQPSSTDGPNSLPPLVKKRLNPNFAAWLMGWPPYWDQIAPIDFGLSETDANPSKSPLPGAFSAWRSESMKHLHGIIAGLGK